MKSLGPRTARSGATRAKRRIGAFLAALGCSAVFVGQLNTRVR